MARSVDLPQSLTGQYPTVYISTKSGFEKAMSAIAIAEIIIELVLIALFI